MEKNSSFLLIIGICIGIGISSVFFNLLHNTVTDDRLEECFEDYAKMARLDNTLSKIQKENCDYQVEDLQKDLNKCKKGK